MKLRRLSPVLAALALVLGATPAHGGTATIDSITVTSQAVTVAGTASFAGDVNTPTKVIDSPTVAIPVPFATFRAGYIGETPDAITFTWQTDAFPVFVPEVVQYFWDFIVQNPAGEAEGFTVTVSMGPDGPHGALDAHGSVVTVTTDIATNSVTASVRRQDLTRAGHPLAVPGASLYDTRFVVGAAICVGPIIDPSACNRGYTQRPYVLGPHVEATIVPDGTTPDASQFDGSWVAPTGAGGAYSLAMPFFPGLGPSVVEVEACTGGHCGPIAVSAPFTA